MTKPNFPGCDDTPAITMPLGAKSGWKRAWSSASSTRLAGGCGSGAVASASSTRASTATGFPPRSSTGFTSTLATSARSAPKRPRPTNSSAMASRSPAGSPRKGSVTRWLARSRPTMARASAWESGAAAKVTSFSASVRMPPRPSTTHGPNWGSRTSPAISSRRPATISPTSTPTAPSSGRARPSRSPAAARNRGGVGETQAHQVPLGLVGDGVAAELGHHGEADALGRGDGGVRVGRQLLASDRNPVLGQELFGCVLGKGARGHGLAL